MPSLIAAIDQGTTSTRCLIFDRDARIRAVSQREHKQILPQPGWVEHDPMEILANVRKVFADALHQLNADPAEISAVGITDQRETTVVWDRHSGVPYTNAIVWQDTRTENLCEVISRRIGGQDRFRAKTGLPISVYFSGLKLRWLLDEVDGLYQTAQRGDLLFGTIDSWLIWNLTGGARGGHHYTDVTNASRTMLMNLKTLNWDAEILSELDIPPQVLPKIMPSISNFGEADFNGVKVPVRSVFGDQQAALFGQGCFSAGEAKNTYGTGCFLLLNTGETAIQSQNRLITTVACQIEGQPAVYALEGSIAFAGSLVQWMRDNLHMISASSEIESLARTVQDNGDVYIVPAFAGLFAPYWRGDARGLIAGLTRFSNAGHIARAVLEASAYQTMDVVAAMERDAGVLLRLLKVDGGMTVNELLMQFQADILGVPIIRPIIRETTALGAAFGAGLGSGIYPNLDALKGNWQAEKSWQPNLDPDLRRKYQEKWHKAVKKSFEWVDLNV